MTLCIMQGHLVLNKFSDCLNFWILFFKSGAVANRAYRAWGAVPNRALFQVRRGCKPRLRGLGGPKSDEKPKTK